MLRLIKYLVNQRKNKGYIMAMTKPKTSKKKEAEEKKNDAKQVKVKLI